MAAVLVLALLLAACGGDAGDTEAGETAPADDASPAAAGETEGGGGAEGDITLAYIQKQGDQQYFVDQAEGARQKAQELGVELVVQDVGLDANAAINALQTVIAQGADGVAIVVPDQGMGPQVDQIAEEAGIPLIASDDSIEGADGEPVPFVGFDGSAMGQSVGEEAARLFEEYGWSDDGATGVISLENPELSVCTDRTDAAREAFTSATGFPEDQIIAVPYENDPDSALSAVATTLTANPGIERWVVWGCNEEGVQGAVRAMGNAGIPADNVLGVGLGAYLACQDWRAGTDTGFKASLFINGAEVGATAVETLVQAIRNDEPLPAETFADTEMVTPDTWEEAGVSCA